MGEGAGAGAGAAGGEAAADANGREDARYDALRERFWEAAGIEGTGLEAFVAAALAHRPDARERARLLRLAEEVMETMLRNIAFKAEEEGGVFERLAEERLEEVRLEHARVVAQIARADAEAADADVPGDGVS